MKAPEGHISDATANQIRQLPDEKLVELAGCAKGHIGYCSSCGAFTAFVGTPTYNDSSECHECGESIPL